MRKLLTRSVLLILMLVLSTALASASEYRVILKNGSWIRAQAKPIVADGKARIRLMAGQLTLIPEAQIDWAASERWSRDERGPRVVAVPENALPQKPAGRQLEGRITMIGERPEAGGTRVHRREAAATPPAPKTPPVAVPVPVEDPDAALRSRIRDVDKQLQELREQKKQLERQAARSLRIEDSTRLREQAAGLGTRIQTLRGQQNALILQLSNRNRNRNR